MNVRTEGIASGWGASLMGSADRLAQKESESARTQQWADEMALAAEAEQNGPDGAPSGELEKRFRQFVAGTFYQRMIASMRSTVKESKLMHGGRAEEIFRQQLDLTLADRLADSHGDDLAGKLYEQFVRQHASQTSSASGEDRVDVQRSHDGLRVLGSPAETLDRVA